MFKPNHEEYRIQTVWPREQTRLTSCISNRRIL